MPQSLPCWPYNGRQDAVMTASSPGIGAPRHYKEAKSSYPGGTGFLRVTAKGWIMVSDRCPVGKGKRPLG